MPIIGDRVEIERKPKLGGGGPGKIPHRRGYGGGDDDHGKPGDFHSREQRMRRYRIAMTLCIISVTAIFVLLTMVYVFRLGKGRYDEDTHKYVQDWIPLALPLHAVMGKLNYFGAEQRDPGISAAVHGKKRRVCCHGHCSSADETRHALAGTYGAAGILLSGRTGSGME